jgi:hypothetical protein
MKKFATGTIVKSKDKIYIIIDEKRMIPIDSTNCTRWIREDDNIEFIAENVWYFIQNTIEKATTILDKPEKVVKVPKKVNMRKSW